MSDIEINRRLRSGDATAFEIVFKNYYSRLLGFTKVFVSDNIFAEDLVQNVFAALWLKREEIDVEKPISSYLMKMTKNVCLDYLKHQVVISKYENEIRKTDIQQLYYFDFLDNKMSPDLEVELTKSILQTAELLPEKCKAVFCMRWIDGFKNREIAEKLNISSTMVEKHLAKGMSIFKKSFKNDSRMLFFFLSLVIQNS